MLGRKVCQNFGVLLYMGRTVPSITVKGLISKYSGSNVEEILIAF